MHTAPRLSHSGEKLPMPESAFSIKQMGELRRGELFKPLLPHLLPRISPPTAHEPVKIPQEAKHLDLAFLPATHPYNDLPEK